MFQTTSDPIALHDRPVLDLDGVRPAPIAPRLTFRVGGKPVLVFDDLFTEQFVETFAMFLLRQDYRPRPSFDNELSAAMTPEFLGSLPALPDIAEAILRCDYPAIAGVPNEQVLSHGYSAAIRHGDSCEIHQDVTCDDCVTFLYYGNLVWNEAWGGETVFCDRAAGAGACVSPRPGRLVLFPAAIHHRAGVPARDCPTFRYGLSLFYRCPRMLQRPVRRAAPGV